jgi:hypothetical protein
VHRLAPYVRLRPVLSSANPRAAFACDQPPGLR